MSRELPPASVWLLAMPLVGAPAAAIRHTAARGWYDLVVFFGVLAFASGLAIYLVATRRPAALTVLGWVAVVVGVTAGVGGATQAARGRFRAAADGLPVAGWAATVGGLVRWPETRRWCGLLPPKEAAS
jgi:hypothetical protein